MKEKEEMMRYTHLEYRKAKIVHLININKEEEFLFQGKAITKEEADSLVETYKSDKKKK